MSDHKTQVPTPTPHEMDIFTQTEAAYMAQLRAELKAEYPDASAADLEDTITLSEDWRGLVTAAVRAGQGLSAEVLDSAYATDDNHLFFGYLLKHYPDAVPADYLNPDVRAQPEIVYLVGTTTTHVVNGQKTKTACGRAIKNVYHIRQAAEGYLDLPTLCRVCGARAAKNNIAAEVLTERQRLDAQVQAVLMQVFNNEALPMRLRTAAGDVGVFLSNHYSDGSWRTAVPECMPEC